MIFWDKAYVYLPSGKVIKFRCKGMYISINGEAFSLKFIGSEKPKASIKQFEFRDPDAIIIKKWWQ